MLLGACGPEREKGKEDVAEPSPLTPAEEQVPVGLADEALAEWLLDRGRDAEALPVLERVVAQRREAGEAEMGRQRLGVALMGLGMVRDALGESEQGLADLAEAWEIFQESGVSPDLQGACADALGLACQGAGYFGDAERAFHAAIELQIG